MEEMMEKKMMELVMVIKMLMGMSVWVEGVVHGTPKAHKVMQFGFDAAFLGSTTNCSEGWKYGFFFTDSVELASVYASFVVGSTYTEWDSSLELRSQYKYNFDEYEKARHGIISVQLLASNPMIVDASKYVSTDDVDTALEEAVQLGHDAVMFENIKRRGIVSNQYVVFSTEQIRIIGCEPTELRTKFE